MHRLNHRVRRFVVMLGGEVAQSAFHFGLNIALARSLSPHDYGRFAILFLVGGLALTYVRALAGVPAGIYIPSRAGRRTGHGYEVTFGSAALLLSGGIGLAVAATLWIATDISAVAGGLFVTLWTLRSYIRLALFAKRRAAASGLGDLAFALSGTGLAVALRMIEGEVRLDAMLTALAFANAIGIATSLALLRQRVRISFGHGMRRRYRALLPSLSWSLIGTTTANIQGQGQSLLVAFIAGPAAYAPIAAIMVLFAPLRLSASALINMAQPEMAAHLAAGRFQEAKRVALHCAGLMALGGAAFGGAVVALLPLISARLFAGQFADAPLTLIAICAWAIVAISLIHAPLRVLFETQQAFRMLAILAAVSAVVGSLIVVGLLLVAQPVWSLLGVLVSECLVLGYCSFVLRSPRFKSSECGPAPPDHDGLALPSR